MYQRALYCRLTTTVHWAKSNPETVSTPLEHAAPTATWAHRFANRLHQQSLPTKVPIYSWLLRSNYSYESLAQILRVTSGIQTHFLLTQPMNRVGWPRPLDLQYFLALFNSAFLKDFTEYYKHPVHEWYI